HSRIKQRRLAFLHVRSSDAPFAHSIPGDMDPAIFTNRDLCTANRPNSHGRVRLGVHLDRLRKVLLAGLTANVENVAAFRVALEIDEVDDAFGIHCRLRLDAAAGSAEQTHLRSAIAGPADRSEENQCKRGSQTDR